MKNELVIVIDFGGQYNQLVARRVRECNVYCEIYSYKIGIDKIKEMNPKGIILTGGPNSVYEEGEYKIFAAFIVNTLPEHDNGDVFQYNHFVNAENEEEFNAFVDEVRRRSLFDTSVDVEYGDELLTLSTCTYEFHEARFIIVARKVRDGESETVDTSQATMNPSPLYPDIWYQLFGGTKPDEAQLKAALHAGQ